MTSIPDNVDPKKLAELLSKARKNDRVLTPYELTGFANTLISQTNDMILAMSKTQFAVTDPKRSAYFNSARRSLIAAVRNLNSFTRA